MLVENSFDLWRRDAFFSAAEEVQESADRMESVYRTWLRERSEVLASQYLYELSRELQTALGTAKWQLEEFEKAVKMSYRNNADESTTIRHREFVAAIENQISQVEAALAESFFDNSKKPLRWVTLEKHEQDGFVAFLSGVPGTSKGTEDECSKLGSPAKEFTKIDSGYEFDALSDRDMHDQAEIQKHGVCIDVDANHVMKLNAKEISGSDDMRCHDDCTFGGRKTWSLPEAGTLRVLVDNGDEQNSLQILRNEATPKEKGSKPSFWMARCNGHSQARATISSHTNVRGINWINEFFRKLCRSQRQLQTPAHMQFSCSFQHKFALMLMIFLIVPFVLYAT